MSSQQTLLDFLLFLKCFTWPPDNFVTVNPLLFSCISSFLSFFWVVFIPLDKEIEKICNAQSKRERTTIKYSILPRAAISFFYRLCRLQYLNSYRQYHRLFFGRIAHTHTVLSRENPAIEIQLGNQSLLFSNCLCASHHKCEVKQSLQFTSKIKHVSDETYTKTQRKKSFLFSLRIKTDFLNEEEEEDYFWYETTDDADKRNILLLLLLLYTSHTIWQTENELLLSLNLCGANLFQLLRFTDVGAALHFWLHPKLLSRYYYYTRFSTI